MPSTYFTYKLLWPFVKEWLFGGKTFSELYNTDKKTLFLLLLTIIMSVSLVTIFSKYLSLKSDYNESQKKLLEAELSKMEEIMRCREEVIRSSVDYNRPIVITIPNDKPIPTPNPSRNKDNKPRVPLPRDEVTQEKRKGSYLEFFEKTR